MKTIAEPWTIILVQLFAFDYFQREADSTLYLLRAFAFLKRFSGYTHPIGFHDSIFNVAINSAAVLKHPRLKFSGNVIATFPFCFVDL